MKLKLLFAFALGAVTLSASAQLGSYRDGVDNYNAGRLDVAKAILNKTLDKAETDKAVSFYYLGCISLNEKNIDEARKNFEAGIAANPKYGYNFIGLGEIALINNDKGTAEKQFKLATNTDKKNTALGVAVARAYYNVNPTLYAKEIKKRIEKALKDSKNTEPAVYILQGDMEAANDPGEAAGKYEMAIMQDDERGNVNREAYVKYANTYFRVNPNFAIERLKELNAKEPTSALAQRELAEKLYDNENYGQACQQYEKYMKNPNHFQRDEQRFAGLLFSAKRYQESLEIAKKILASDPNNQYMYRVLLLNKSALEDFPGAVEAGKTLFSIAEVKLIPNDYILYGTALSETGDAAAAVKVFEKAIELNPDKPELLTELSAVYDRAGDKEKAVATQKKYLDMGNGTVTDLLSMARRYQSLAGSQAEGSVEAIGSYDEAIKYADMAIVKAGDTLTPGSLASLFRAKGGILLGKNLSEPNAEVAECYNKVVELVSQDSNPDRFKPYVSEAYRVLGVYYVKIDDIAKGKEIFEKYLELNPDDESIREVVNKL